MTFGQLVAGDSPDPLVYTAVLIGELRTTDEPCCVSTAVKLCLLLHVLYTLFSCYELPYVVFAIIILSGNQPAVRSYIKIRIFSGICTDSYRIGDIRIISRLYYPLRQSRAGIKIKIIPVHTIVIPELRIKLIHSICSLNQFTCNLPVHTSCSEFTACCPA